jgi:hypothetical protein
MEVVDPKLSPKPIRFSLDPWVELLVCLILVLLIREVAESILLTSFFYTTLSGTTYWFNSIELPPNLSNYLVAFVSMLFT